MSTINKLASNATVTVEERKAIQEQAFKNNFNQGLKAVWPKDELANLGEDPDRLARFYLAGHLELEHDYAFELSAFALGLKEQIKESDSSKTSDVKHIPGLKRVCKAAFWYKDGTYNGANLKEELLAVEGEEFPVVSTNGKYDVVDLGSKLLDVSIKYSPYFHPRTVSVEPVEYDSFVDVFNKISDDDARARIERKREIMELEVEAAAIYTAKDWAVTELDYILYKQEHGYNMPDDLQLGTIVDMDLGVRSRYISDNWDSIAEVGVWDEFWQEFDVDSSQRLQEFEREYEDWYCREASLRLINILKEERYYARG